MAWSKPIFLFCVLAQFYAFIEVAGVAQVEDFFLDGDARNVSDTVVLNTHNTGLIVPGEFDVPGIGAMVGWPQIRPPVVEFILVDVVDHGGAFTSNPQVYQAVDVAPFLVYRGQQVPGGVNVPNGLPSVAGIPVCPAAGARKMSKDSGFRIVVKQGAGLGEGNIHTFSPLLQISGRQVYHG